MTQFIICAESAVTVDPCPSGQAPAVREGYLLSTSTGQQFEEGNSLNIQESFDYFYISFWIIIVLWSLGWAGKQIIKVLK